MKLNRTPSLHDRNWRNEENENWESIESALKGITEIDSVNEDVKQMIQEVLDVHLGQLSKFSFEIGTISNTTGGHFPSKTAMRTPNAIPLKVGDVVNPLPHSDYEYSLMLYKNGEWFGGWGLGWYKFGTEYEIPENYDAFVVVARIDRATLTEEDVAIVEQAFRVERTNTSNNSNVISPTFEKGGWIGVSGKKVTGDNPVQMRSTRPYKVSPGMKIQPSKNSLYEYNILLHQDGKYIGWNSWTNFGESFVFDDYYEARISIERKDDAVINDTDLANVKKDFGNISMDLLEYLKILGVFDNQVNLRFEPGGWLASTGEKVTGSNPYQIRNIEPFQAKKGMIIAPSTGQYNYNVLLFKNGESLGWQGRQTFNIPFEFTDDYTVRLSIERLDQAPVTSEDIKEVSRLFGNVEKSHSNGISKTIDKFNIVGELEPVLTSEITNHFPEPNTRSAQAIHNSFIGVIDRHADCASYELLGQDGYSNNMYKYELIPNIMKSGGTEWLRPPRGTDGTPLNPPKIILTAGVHGKERSASYALYQFMRNLLDNPDNNPVFDTLKDNVHFIIIPIGTPNGFNDNSYENRAGVNINRDFPPHGSVTQPETVHIKRVLDENSDADYHIDFHNFFPWDYNNDILGYSLTDSKDLARLTTNAYKYVGRQWQKKHSILPQDRNYQWTYTANANIGTVAKYTTDVLGIPGTIIETPHWLNLMGETEVDIHSALITQLGTDILTNLVVSIIEARK